MTADMSDKNKPNLSVDEKDAKIPPIRIDLAETDAAETSTRADAEDAKKDTSSIDLSSFEPTEEQLETAKHQTMPIDLSMVEEITRNHIKPKEESTAGMKKPGTIRLTKDTVKKAPSTVGTMEVKGISVEEAKSATSKISTTTGILGQAGSQNKTSQIRQSATASPERAEGNLKMANRKEAPPMMTVTPNLSAVQEEEPPAGLAVLLIIAVATSAVLVYFLATQL